MQRSKFLAEHAHNHTLDRKDLEKRNVQLRFKSDPKILTVRKCLSEHPFGTVKWYHDAHYLLCRGKEKATGELGLSFLVYNLKRAISLVGVTALIAGMQAKQDKKSLFRPAFRSLALLLVCFHSLSGQFYSINKKHRNRGKCLQLRCFWCLKILFSDKFWRRRSDAIHTHAFFV